MVRSLSVWVLLASSGLAAAQSPAATPQPMVDGAGATLLVHEQGRTASKCKVLKTWLLPDGTRAYQAQALVTGEMMTVVESGPPDAVTPNSSVEARATQVYHWAGSHASPPGAPLPPDGVTAPAMTRPAMVGMPNSGTKLPPGTAVETTIHTKVDRDEVVTTVSTTGGQGMQKPGMTSPTSDPLPPYLGGGVHSVPAEPQSYTPADMSSLPPGSGSVMAAGGPQYVPVPLVTVPDYRNTPQPPPVRMPMPPQPTGVPPYSPPPPNMGYGSPNEGNAFTPAGPQMPEAMRSNGFGPTGPAMPQQMPQQPYGGMPPAYVPPQPMSRPMPNPAMNVPPPAASRAIDPAVQRAANANAPQAMNTLRNALLPSEREMAVSQLSMVDWRSNTAVVQVLVTSACEDPAASVRSACVRALASMNVNTVPVYTALQHLRNDGDPRVLAEVEQALAVLAPGLTQTSPDVQQAGGYLPR